METKEKSYWTAQLIAVIIINIFNGLSSFMVNPIMSAYLVDRGLDFRYTGLIASLMSYVALVFRPFSGAASDRFNKKKMMIISYGVVACCMILYCLSNSITFSIVIRIIHGIAFAICTTLSISFASGFAPAKYLAESLGYITLGNLIGQMFGPSLGSAISDRYGLGYTFISAAVFNLIAITMIAFLPYRKAEKSSYEKRKLTISSFFATKLFIYVFLVAVIACAGGIQTYYLKPYGVMKGISISPCFIRPLLWDPFCSSRSAARSMTKKEFSTS